MRSPPPPLVLPVLGMALLAFSASAVLVRLAPGVPPLSAAFWRCAFVAALLAPSLLRPRAARLGRGDLGLVVLAGGLLAGHFLSWFESLHHTSVLRSTVLVCLSPAWAAGFERLFLGERPALRFQLGLGLAVGTVLAVGLLQDTARPATLAGEGLALLAGVLSAAYMVIGRVVRARVEIGPYGSVVCGAAAAWLLLLALLSSPLGMGGIALIGFSASQWLVLLGLALGPQLFGHIGLNYAVRYLPAGLVAMVVLLEPAGAGLLAGLVLDEWPGPLDLAGAGIVLVGLGLATVPGRARPSSPPPEPG